MERQKGLTASHLDIQLDPSASKLTMINILSDYTGLIIRGRYATAVLKCATYLYLYLSISIPIYIYTYLYLYLSTSIPIYIYSYL